MLAGGTLNLTIRELWNAPIWNQLAGLAGTQNIVDIYEALAANPAYVTCQSIIQPPDGSRPRGKVYHNCVVVDIADDDTVTVGALAVAKGIVVAYTHSTAL